MKVFEEISNQAAMVSLYDNALFYLREGSHLQGLICSHVDDFFFNGSQLFHTKVIDHIRTTFSLSKEFFNQMSFIGIEISQNTDKANVLYSTSGPGAPMRKNPCLGNYRII